MKRRGQGKDVAMVVADVGLRTVGQSAERTLSAANLAEYNCKLALESAAQGRL